MDQLFAAVAAHGDTLGISALLVAVLGILLRALASGRLVFKKQLDELRVDKDAEVARTVAYYDKLIDSKDKQVEDWRAAYGNEATARAAQASTLDDMLELARAADHMLRALPSSAPVAATLLPARPTEGGA